MKNSKFPLWLTIVCVILIFWNFIGILNFIGQITISEQDLMNLPIDQQNLINERPLWALASFAIAVLFGFLGSITLLIKKKFANILLRISLIAVLIDFYYGRFVFEAQNPAQSIEIILTIMIISMAILLVYLASFANKKSWLR